MFDEGKIFHEVSKDFALCLHEEDSDTLEGALVCASDEGDGRYYKLELYDEAL